MSNTGQRGRLVHNEQFAPFYDSVAFENTPNLHAGLCGTKVGRRGGSSARYFGALERQKKNQEDIFISK
jgi:hypothetical protein